MENKKHVNYGPLLLVATALLWSVGGLIIKSVPFHGISVASMRGIIASVAAFLLLKNKKFSFSRAQIINMICYFAQSIFFICANKFTTAGNATVLQNTSPLYIIILAALLFRQKPKKMEIVACAVLFCGIAFAFSDNFDSSAVLGNCLALISALFYAGVFFTSRLPGVELHQSIVLGNAIYFLFIPFWFVDPAFKTAVPLDFLAVAAFGLLCGCFSWVIFSKGIKTTPALTANFITMIEPVLSPVWCFIFLHEVLGVRAIIGAAIVIVTLTVYNTISIKSKGKKEDAGRI